MWSIRLEPPRSIVSDSFRSAYRNTVERRNDLLVLGNMT